jgi:hypothetical protein
MVTSAGIEVMLGDVSASDQRTSVSIYADDLSRLRSMQRRVSAAKDQWLTLPEVIRELLNAVEKQGEGA